ncbi:hypothetical protein SGPA1_31303 [Streptomyces misionensis JCM 4497]
MGRPRLPAGRGGRQGAHPRGRGLPGRALPALRDPVHGERPGRLPGAAGHQPLAVHVPVPVRGLRRGRLLPGGPGQGRGRAGDGAPHRGHPAARSHAAGGPGARRGTARRPQGARRAPDAGRPRAQRPRAGLRARLRRGRRLHVDRALLARDAHRLDRDRPGRRRPHRLRRAHRLLPGRHPLRRPQAPGDADHRRTGTVPARSVRRLRRLPGLRGRLRHGHRHPHRPAARRHGVRPGRSRRGRRLRPGRGGPGVPQQGRRGAQGGAHGQPAPGSSVGLRPDQGAVPGPASPARSGRQALALRGFSRWTRRCRSGRRARTDRRSRCPPCTGSPLRSVGLHHGQRLLQEGGPERRHRLPPRRLRLGRGDLPRPRHGQRGLPQLQDPSGGGRFGQHDQPGRGREHRGEAGREVRLQQLRRLRVLQ